VRNALPQEQLKSIYNRVAKRYDFQHGFLTARSDERGRRMVVMKTVRQGDRVLDAGTGTGSTALLAAQKVGSQGKVTLFDMSAGMLAIARKRVATLGLQSRVELYTGDMVHLPFEDNSFDVVVTTYSLCPLYDPARGILELYRVVKPGGRIGAAHSTNPENPLVKWLADRVEGLVWYFPWLSLGCRSVAVLPVLEQAGGKLLFKKKIGVPLWPFVVFVVEKPAP